MITDLARKRILVTGGSGFLGSHVVEKLLQRGVPSENIVVPRFSSTSPNEKIDLTNAVDCNAVLSSNIQIIIHLAGNVGGIGYNKEHPVELLKDNLLMGLNLLDAAHAYRVEKFVVIGTVCSYPKFAPVPFKEEYLHMAFADPDRPGSPATNYPEETNAPYGLSKRLLFEQAQAYRRQHGFNAICLLPVNLYGPRDHFDPQKSHVVPALIKKVADAQRDKQAHIDVWGTGNASREFLYIEDAAEAIVLATERYNRSDPINIGAGREILIRDLVSTICRLMNFKGEIRWDPSKPDGQPRRMLDTSRAEREFGFKSTTDFETGLEKTIAWYLDQK